MKKMLLTLTAVAGMLITLGCESTDTTKPTETAKPIGASKPVEDLSMTPSERRVMQMQGLDQEYAAGGMTPAEYNMRREQIIEMY
ncbi:hypothetical protein [Cerasicoccus frondis]|uniref:hypothetical protein n=1 Tax=Cerasicoccus frondis TaxID=490090 RepID=UPI0028529293|nr:hypothetical protein [Cerasicoccus frondis]